MTQPTSFPQAILQNSQALTALQAQVQTLAVTAGTPGPAGAAGLGFVFLGAWQPNTAYVINDVVTYQGATYSVVANFTSGATFSTTNLGLMAQAGVNGTNGAPGPQGMPGPQAAYLYNWNPNTQLINYRNSLALTAAGVAGNRTKIMLLGDSTTYGVGSTNDNTNKYHGVCNLLTTALNKVVPTQISNFLGGGPGDPEVTFTGQGNFSGIQSCAGQVMSLNSGDTATITMPPGIFNNVDVWYINGNGLSFEVSVDGGTAQTVSPASSTAPIGSTTVSIPLGVHSQVLVNNNGSNNVFLLGAVFWNSLTPAVEIYNFGQPGATSQGIANGTTAQYGSTGGVYAQNGQLLIINIGINDINNGSQTAAQTVADIAPLVTAAKSQNCDVILVLPQPFQSGNYATGIAALRTAYQQYCVQENLGMIDLSAYYNNQTYANLWFNNLHPNAILYRDMALLYKSLIEQPGSDDTAALVPVTVSSPGSTMALSFAPTGDASVLITPTANLTLTITPGLPGVLQLLHVYIVATSYTVTLPAQSSTVKYEGGSLPAISTSSGNISKVTYQSINGTMVFGQ